jgi:hypothetical protein
VRERKRAAAKVTLSLHQALWTVAELPTGNDKALEVIVVCKHVLVLRN